MQGFHGSSKGFKLTERLMRQEWLIQPLSVSDKPTTNSKRWHLFLFLAGSDLIVE